MAEGGLTAAGMERTTAGDDVTTERKLAQPNRVRIRHGPSVAPDPGVHVIHDPLRAALSFLRPFLHHFGFTPSHAMLRLRGKIPAVDRDKMLTIIHQEQDQNLAGASAALLDCLLAPDAEPHDALFLFRDALSSDTSEHTHVRNVICVSSVYLPVHRHLVNAMALRLQDGTLQMGNLLPLLKHLKLLQPELEARIRTMAQISRNNEECVGVASFLLACLYSNQAKILAEMQGANADQGNTDDAEHGANVAIQTGPDAGIDAIAQVIGTTLRSSNNSTTPPHRDPQEHSSVGGRSVGQSGSRAAGNDVNSSTGQSQTDPASSGRCEQPVLTWLLQRGCVWTKVLQQVLVQASSAQGEVWGSLLDHTHDAALWSAARGMIRTVVTQEENGTGSVNDGNDEGDSVAGSSDSTETVRPLAETMALVSGLEGNLNRIKQQRVNQYLETQKMHLNITCDSDVDGFQDDVTSLFSMESNSCQHERRTGVLGGLCGVLREEEARSLKEGPIQLRPYQDELLESARQGKNVLIWLPTGTGKTYIVLKYAEEHLKSSPHTRVGFVVPKVRLARQQFERFMAYLPQFKPHLKTGETSGSKQHLGDVLQTSRVVVMTGQCLVEAVDKDKVTLDQFTLLVLDECHHTRGGHPLRAIMNQYMELKFLGRNGNVRLPQIIGLTASPGIGKARGNDVVEAGKYLRQLCARLDVSHICSVRKQQADLQLYINQPVLDVHECEKRKADKLKERLESLMEAIEKRMCVDADVGRYLKQLHKQHGELSPERLLKRLEAPVMLRGGDQYSQWLSHVEETIREVNHQEAYYALTAHIDMLRRCQRCLILNEDCDSLGALELLTEDVDTLRSEKPGTTRVDQELFELFERYTQYTSNSNLRSLVDECSRRECQNPKLKHLEEVLLNATRDTQAATTQQLVASSELQGSEEGSAEPEGSEAASSADASEWSDVASATSSEYHHLDEKVRGMIFVRTLDLSKALLIWMKRHPKLKWLNPGRITGINASVKDGGMTKSEVTEVMAKFNAGVHKLVICTSAAEEGLDFKACNLVIRYLYEASMVSMIQTRGRAREQNSMYCVMGRENSGSLAKESENVQSEVVMRKAVDSIQTDVERDPKAHRDAIQKLQRDNWNNRWRKDVQEAKRLQQQLPEGVYKLMCYGCRIPVCTSEDIRLLRSTNRVVIGAEFSNKYERQDPNLSQLKAYDDSIPRTGTMHCKICGHYWGIIVRSVVDNVEFPVIPIKSFIIENSAGVSKYVEKWSKAFSVPEITDEDRLRHSDPLIGSFCRLEGEDEEEEEQENEPSQRPNSLSDSPGPPERENEDDQQGSETSLSDPDQ